MEETLSDAMVVEVKQKGDWKNERKKLDCPVLGSLRIFFWHKTTNDARQRGPEVTD